MVSHGFLKIIQKGLRAPNEYVFLWHAVFETAVRTDKASQDRTDMSAQDRNRMSAPISRESRQESPIKESPSPSSSDFSFRRKSLPASPSGRPAPPYNHESKENPKTDALRTFLIQKLGAKVGVPGRVCLQRTIHNLGGAPFEHLASIIDRRAKAILSYGLIPELARDAAQLAAAPETMAQSQPRPLTAAGKFAEEYNAKRKPDTAQPR